MVSLTISTILISTILIVIMCAFFFFDWIGIFKLRSFNKHRIKKFKHLANLYKNFPQKKKACQIIFYKISNIESSWLLSEREWNIYENVHIFLSNIASAYHPKSKNPILEARIGKLIGGLGGLNRKILKLLKLLKLQQLMKL